MLEFIDISPMIHEKMVRWPGVEPTRLWRSETMEKNNVNVTNCTFCAHVGLHVDAPLHHVAGGETIEQLSFEGLLGVVYVADFTDVDEAVDVGHLGRLNGLDSYDILALRTRNSTTKTTWESFDTSLIYITAEASKALIARGIKGLVVDSLTVEKYGVPYCISHKSLLAENRIRVIEGADLRKVEPGFYFLACLPLRLQGSDGAPARAVLIKDTTGAFLNAWRQEKKIFPS